MRPQVLRKITALILGGLLGSLVAAAHAPDDRILARTQTRPATPPAQEPKPAPAAPGGTPWGLPYPHFPLPESLRNESNQVLTRESARGMMEPVGVGEFAVGFGISKLGEGWYFGHSGGNWGFRCDLIAHKVKGYGIAIMTNGDHGGIVIRELKDRIARVYDWDSVDKPIPR